MGQGESKPAEPVSRTTLPGLDIVTITGEAAVRKAVDTGDLCRLEEAAPELDDLPWLFKLYFPVARFWSTIGGYFLNMTGETAARYPPCRAFLDKNFTPGSYDVSSYVKQAADVLLNQPVNKKSDKELQDIFIRALLDRFFEGGPIPDAVIRHAENAIVEIPETFNPVGYAKAKNSVPKVFEYTDNNLKVKDTHKGSVTDVGHGIFASEIHGLALLRAAAEDPNESAAKMFARLGRTKQVPRMTKTNTSLNGLLPENKPIVAGKTVVLLNIRDTAQSTLDHAWAFGTGTAHRRCAAEPALLEFVDAVKAELKSRNNG